MYRLILYILLITPFMMKAQDSLMVAGFDEISGDYYSRKEWGKLIDLSDKMLDKGVDYYYLRFRIGVAYYELKQYRTALYHFEKAYAMNEDNDVLKEYLYYCYINTEQYAQALRITSKFSTQSLKNTKTDDPTHVSFLHSEYGLKYSTNDSLYKPMNYFQIGFGFRFGRDITAYNSYSYISQQVYDGSLTQHQYYVCLNIPSAKSWTLMPAFHYLNVNYSYTKGKVNNTTPVIFSFAAEKVHRDFTINFGATVSTLQQKTQFQQQIGVTYYPMHNNVFSVSAGTILFTDSLHSFLPMPFASSKYYFTRKFSLTLNYLYGGAANFTESNGYLASNSPDITHQKVCVLIDWNFYKNFGIYGVYLHETKTEDTSHLDYKYNMALAGIKLIF